MKANLTPIPYPTTKEEEYAWGFDVYKPEGTPKARVIDWTSAGAGWGVTLERTFQVMQYQVDEDLSKLTVDELSAALSRRLKHQWHGFWNMLEQKLGIEKSLEIAREMALAGGQVQWKNVQANFGKPLTLDKIVWYQDITHLISGPSMRPHSWCDDRKAVCARTECVMRPPEGLEHCARYCRASDDAFIEGYLAMEPDLFAVKAVDLGDNAEDPRCIHLWTYDKEVIEGLPDDLKKKIPDTLKKVLEERGARL